MSTVSSLIFSYTDHPFLFSPYSMSIIPYFLLITSSIFPAWVHHLPGPGPSSPHPGSIIRHHLPSLGPSSAIISPAWVHHLPDLGLSSPRPGSIISPAWVHRLPSLCPSSPWPKSIIPPSLDPSSSGLVHHFPGPGPSHILINSLFQLYSLVFSLDRRLLIFPIIHSLSFLPIKLQPTPIPYLEPYSKQSTEAISHLLLSTMALVFFELICTHPSTCQSGACLL